MIRPRAWRLLRRVVSCDPTHARAHLRLASASLRQFDAAQRATGGLTIVELADVVSRAESVPT